MITMFWGGTFLAVQYAVSLSGPLFFVGLRFATAALAVGLLSLRTLRGLTWLEVKAGVAIGVAIALGYGLQTWGLQSISSSKSAFITAMYVPLVPLLQWLCLGRMPGVMSCVGIVLAFIGLILLAGPENNLLALGVGEMITLASALAIAAEIILISAWAGKVDVRRVTVVQLATASLVAFAAMKPAGESVPPLTPTLLGVALGLGIFSAIIQVTMNWPPPCALPALWKTECRKINRERNLPGINIEVVALLSAARAGKYSVVPLFRRVAAAPYPAYVRTTCR